MQRTVERSLASLEGVALSFLGRVATWIAPAVPAILLARSTSMVFRLEGWLAWVVAIIVAVSVELMGLEAVHAWARARHWNHERDDVDEPASERKAAGYIIYYLLVSEAFIVGFGLYLGVVEGWWWEMLGALFPPFSYLAAQLMIERDTHTLRVLQREERLSERRAELERRRQERKESVKPPGNVDVKFTGRVSDEAVISIFAGNPAMSLRDAGNALGISHTAVKNRLAALEQQGRIKRNGHGVEVL